jgi:O-antigen/teichoic acid export membrane protein
VASYVLFLGVAGALNVFLDAAVFTFFYPLLIKLNHEKKNHEAQRQVRELLIQRILMSAFYGLTSWLLLPDLLQWIGNPSYEQSAHWYPWLLAAMLFNAIGKVPHYALYAAGRDTNIILSHIGALFIFILATWFFSQIHSAIGVLIGLNFAYIFILVWKSLAYLDYSKNIFQFSKK